MTSEKIISLKNENIKEVSALRDRKARDKRGLTVIDDVRELRMAINAGIEVREFYFCPALIEEDVLSSLMGVLSKKKIRTIEVSKSVLEKISFGDRIEGIVSVVRTPKRGLNDIQLGSSALLVVLEAVEKPGNLGAVLRTCDAAGADGLIVCDGGTDVYNPNVIRSSQGAVFTVPVVVADNKEALDYLRKHRIRSVGTFPGAKSSLWKADLKSSIAVVLGSEHSGLSEFWHKNADERIQVPMQGEVNSLNVSITAALALYEAMRQRES